MSLPNKAVFEKNQTGFSIHRRPLVPADSAHSERSARTNKNTRAAAIRTAVSCPYTPKSMIASSLPALVQIASVLFALAVVAQPPPITLQGTTQSSATTENTPCVFTVDFGDGGSAVVSVISDNGFATVTVSAANHQGWLGMSLSSNGLMVGSTAIVVHSADEDPDTATVDPFYLATQLVSGIQKLNSTEAAAYGVDVVAWSTSIDAEEKSTSFSFTIAADSLNDAPFFMVAGSPASFGLVGHGVTNGVVVAPSGSWVGACYSARFEALSPVSCDIKDEDKTCLACGFCSYKPTLGPADFSHYPVSKGLYFPNQLAVTLKYQISWIIYPPKRGSSLTEDGETPFAHFLVQAETDGWLGFGIVQASSGSTVGMEGTDVYWGGFNADDDLVFVDGFAKTVRMPPSDLEWGGTSDIFGVAGGRHNGVTSVEFKRYLSTSDFADVSIEPSQNMQCVWAHSAVADTELTAYHRYNRGFVEVRFYDAECHIGEYVDGSVCVPCLLGHYCPDREHMFPCEPGSFGNMPGLVDCISCDNSPFMGYSNSSGAVTCTECPANTERTLTSSLWSGSRREECVCKFGFYSPNGNPGEGCLPCPVGGYCVGSTEPPKAQPGYWGIAMFSNKFVECQFIENGACSLSTNTTVDAWFEQLGTDGDNVLSTFEALPLPTRIPALRELANQTNFENMTKRRFLSVLAVPATSSDSYVPFNPDTGDSMCSPGYGGEMCSTCEDGYFRFEIRCYECPEHSGSAMVFGLIAVLVVWVVVARVGMWFESNSLDLLMLFMQCLNLVLGFSLHWHSWITPLRPVFSLVSFDMAILNPTCIMPWTYHWSLLLQMGLPVVLISWCSLRLAMSKCLIQRGYAGKYVCCGVWFAVPSNLTKAKNKQISFVTSFLFIVYSELVAKSLAPFQLVNLPDGRRVMEAAPFVEAWSEEHWLLQAGPGLLGIVFYVIGIPLAAVIKLMHLKAQHLLAEDDIIERFHWLYGKYKLDAYLWEILILVRRMLLCVFLEALRGWPFTQGIMTVLVLLALLVAQMKTLPFRRTFHNLLDTAYIGILIFVAFAGLMLQGGCEFPDSLAFFVVAAIVTSSVAAVGQAVSETIFTFRKRIGTRRLRLPTKITKIYACALNKRFMTLSVNSLAQLSRRGLPTNSQSRSIDSTARSRAPGNHTIGQKRRQSVYSFPVDKNAGQTKLPKDTPFSLLALQALLKEIARKAWKDVLEQTKSDSKISKAISGYKASPMIVAASLWVVVLGTLRSGWGKWFLLTMTKKIFCTRQSPTGSVAINFNRHKATILENAFNSK